MNCKQAQAMLASYRELKPSQADTTALDVHLEECAACRQVLAQQSFVGERVRQLPVVEPAPDAHARLMRALAAEHAQFLQRSSSSQAASASPAPDFLKPYLKEHLHTQRATRPLTAFSTAETGPLPIIQAKTKRRVSYTGQFAILGIAASFLMVLLIGGLVSLLLLANHGTSGSITTSVVQQSQVALANYTTETAYPNVVSAVANQDRIYYSAYGNGEQHWMIEQVDGAKKNTISTPLLSKASSSSLFVLSTSRDWLVWIEMDASHPITHSATHQKYADAAFTRGWSLQALFLGGQQTAPYSINTPITLAHDTFNSSTAPAWVHTPVQGLWFIGQNTLLVATIDKQGNSQLLRYQLDSHQETTVITFATASSGHILTSPTANSDGSTIFWAEEWLANDTLHGNVWLQQTNTSITRQAHGWYPSIATEKTLFRSDEMSFHPQVVDDTLFLLSTSDATALAEGTRGATSTATLTGTTPNATPTIQQTSSITSRVDPALYLSQRDETLRGTILAFALDDPTAPPTVLSDYGVAAAPQGGTRFLLWQSDKGYQMYDAVAKSYVTVGANTVSKTAPFLAVNDEAAVWIADASNQPNTGEATTPVTFDFFRWPTSG